jgi:hypothetical protein
MLIFTKNSKYYVFIHIPKNGGKFIRKNIINDTDNIILKTCWGIDGIFDLAHIPYIKRNKYVNDHSIYTYFAYSRNPYDRLISAYFYKFPTQNINSTKSIENLRRFIKTDLQNYTFSDKFEYNIIHYYPQYMFVCDNNFDITDVGVEKLETSYNPKQYCILKFLDAECINIINKIYEKDFILFGYDMII